MAGKKGVGHYSEDFKREAVALARATTFAQAAALLGCCRRSLFKWCERWGT